MSDIREILRKVLFETPIDNFDVITKDTKGNISKDPAAFVKKNASFGKKDDVSKRILTSPKGVEKIKKKFANSETVFDFIFYNGTNAGKFAEYGAMTPEEVKSKLGLDVHADPDKVTVIYVGNQAGDKHMMSPWIIAHRMGHAIRSDWVKNQNNNKHHPWPLLLKEINQCYSHAAEAYGRNLRYSSYGILSNPEEENLMKAITYGVCTFKSARDRTILRPYEVYYELFAQFVTTGKVTFNTLPRAIKAGKNSYGVRDVEAQETADMYFHDLTRYNMDDYANNAINHYLGKILVM